MADRPSVTRVVKYIRKGVGVAYVYVEYAKNQSNTTAPTSGWQTTTPAWQNGYYIWERVKTVFTDGSYQYSNPACLSGGKGITSVTEYYLATASSSGVTTSTSGWTTTIQTVTAAKKYLWNYEVITYTDNSTTTTTPVIIGTYGDKGVGISSITEYYLATASSSGVTTSTSGWTTTIQTVTAAKKYLWNYEVITYTDNSTTTTTPVIIGTYGDTGDRGPALRVQDWNKCTTNGTVNYQFYSGADGEAYKDVVLYNGYYYSCKKSHSNKSYLPTNTTYWTLGDKVELIATNILLATYALISNLGASAIQMYEPGHEGDANYLVFEAKDGALTCKTGTFTNVNISGVLNSVTGSFKSLNCVNESGTVVASIKFGSDGRLWFENGDLYNQGTKDGRTLRFYSGDLWCRGGFGARLRNTMVVYTTYAYYYTKGVGASGVYVALESATSSANETYYKVKCYGTDDDAAGFPVDTIIFANSYSTVYRYELQMVDTQRVLLINANDNQNNVQIYSNGDKITWSGGMVGEAIQVPVSFMTPTPASNLLGRGLLLGPTRDNDWD